jgi:hypothetical protein
MSIEDLYVYKGICMSIEDLHVYKGTCMSVESVLACLSQRLPAYTSCSRPHTLVAEGLIHW